MIKKALILLTIPYLAFVYLESCNKPCDHPETRNITGIDMTYSSGFMSNQNSLIMNINYESIYAQNFQFNLTNKALALSQVFDPCFNRLVNPIDSVSVVSTNDFNLSFPANSELNSLFRVNDQPSVLLLKDYRYDVNEENIYYYDSDLYETSVRFSNDSLPTLDSIHNLCITVYCSNGEVFKDSVLGINLKSNL